MPVESLADKKKRARMVLTLLRKRYPEACCSLDFKTTHQLMVATILSAQCTDERVNLVTPELFRKYPDIESFAEADLNELEKDIYTTGFYSNKAKAIKNSARQLLDDFEGRIPRTLDQLVKLQGVGRKTGSVVLGVGFGLAEGVVVDTHVGRISRLLGFSRQKTPEKVERDLMKILPPKDWIDYSHLLIFHGRALCTARRPDCA
ncbi:MAG: endonuclease III, partial [bacterium]|nr:endonuclease III [bacterium]